MKTLMRSFLVFIGFNVSAANQVSDWSPSSNKVSLRLICPSKLTAGGSQSLFWVKCEIRNEGTNTLQLTNRARLFLTDDYGNTDRCLRLTARIGHAELEEFNYVRPVAPGETLSWLESGQLKKAGHYDLHAVLDAPGVKTPPISVDIAISESTNDQASRETGLQKHFDLFPILEPNTGENEGTYHWVAFTNEPVVVDGVLYHAFRFKAPKQPGVFDWSCIQNLDRGSMSWYIVPRHGTMKGFTRIDRSRDGSAGVPDLTHANDYTIFQELPAENFQPGEEYFIWFSPAHGFPTGVMVSLNFTDSEIVEYRSTPAAIEERKRYDRAAKQL